MLQLASSNEIPSQQVPSKKKGAEPSPALSVCSDTRLTVEVAQHGCPQFEGIGNTLLDQLQQPLNNGKSKSIILTSLYRMPLSQLLANLAQGAFDRTKGLLVIISGWVL